MIYFKILYKIIVDIFVLCLYIYFDILSRLWLLDMGKNLRILDVRTKWSINFNLFVHVRDYLLASKGLNNLNLLVYVQFDLSTIK